MINQPLQLLTPREYQVYKLICNGYAACQIAYELNIKVCTVRAHTKEIFNKLGVHNRTQIAIYTYRQLLKQIANGQIDDPVKAAGEFMEGRA